MVTTRITTLLAAAAALVALSGYIGLPGTSPARAATGVPASAGSLAQSLTGLVNQNGRAFQASSIEGRFVVVSFVFTGCGDTCPTQMNDLARFRKSLPPALAQRLKILSITVDPVNDTPQRLKDFGSNFEVDERNWQLLTGDPDRVEKTAKAFAALAPSQGGRALHTSEVYLFDTRQRMIQRYAGAPLAAARLREDLAVLASLKN